MRRLLVLMMTIPLVVAWTAVAHATTTSFVWLADSLGDSTSSCPPAGTPGFCGAPVHPGAVVRFNVLVGPQGSTPTGTVQFSNAAPGAPTNLGTVPLDAHGEATLTVRVTTSLDVSVHYSGDANFAAADSGLVSVQVVPPGASYTPNTSGFVLDGYGGLHPWRLGWFPLPVPPKGPYWPGWNIARGLAIGAPMNSCSVEVDAWGGLHQLTWVVPPPPRIVGASYWRGWDIARDVVLMPDCSGGYVLDGWGGLHPFGLGGPPPPRVTSGPYWHGWDIARAAVMLPEGTGGYIFDGWGGAHPFGVGGHPAPRPLTSAVYLPGRDVIRGASLLNREGVVLVDTFGTTYTDARDGTAVASIPATPSWRVPIVEGIAAYG